MEFKRRSIDNVQSRYEKLLIGEIDAMRKKNTEFIEKRIVAKHYRKLRRDESKSLIRNQKSKASLNQ